MRLDMTWQLHPFMLLPSLMMQMMFSGPGRIFLITFSMTMPLGNRLKLEINPHRR